MYLNVPTSASVLAATSNYPSTQTSRAGKELFRAPTGYLQSLYLTARPQPRLLRFLAFWLRGKPGGRGAHTDQPLPGSCFGVPPPLPPVHTALLLRHRADVLSWVSRMYLSARASCGFVMEVVSCVAGTAGSGCSTSRSLVPCSPVPGLARDLHLRGLASRRLRLPKQASSEQRLPCPTQAPSR